jgi:hypothetical protein
MNIVKRKLGRNVKEKERGNLTGKCKIKGKKICTSKKSEGKWVHEE